MATVLITGVNRGLGLEFIKQYAAAGWTVLGTCRDPGNAPDAQAVAAEFDTVSLYPLDVANVASISELVKTLGAVAIDVLLLNAGVMGERTGLGTLDAEQFLQVMNVNVVAPALLIEAFAEHVAASDRKIIVGMGSILGSIGSDTGGAMYSYRSSKAGLHAIMHAASVDLADRNITAIAMHPGWVATDMGGAGANLQTPESIAGMMSVIDKLTVADSGKLLTYEGQELPW